MTVYEWVATSNSNANNSANWKPTGVPATGDTAQFNNLSAFACNWDIATVGIIQIDSTYTSIVTFDTDCEIETGLSVSLDNCIDSTTNTTITFSGAPAYNTNKTYVQINTTDMFRTSSARSNLLFKFDGSYYITLDAGTYPHLEFTNGFRPEYIAPTLTDNKYNVKVLSMKFGNVNVEPSSATPSSDDRLMNFIIEGTTDLVGTSAQFSLVDNTSNHSFDGGYGTWTFQTTTSGWTLPVSGNTTMGTWTFTWRKWILDSTADGSGSFSFLPFGSVVSLNDLTINRGSSLKGNDSYGATIHLVNRPNIKGTWGFTPIADGIYYYKGLYNLNVSFGGTGLNYIPANRILFGNNSQKLSHSSNLTWDGSEFNINGKLTVSGLIDPTGLVLTEQASDPASTGAGEGTIWVKNTATTTLYFTDSAGTDHQLGVGGGGGGSGTVTSIATTAPITGGTITTTGTIGISAATTSADGSMSAGDKLKLDGIETNADVTDATNVAAAGAIMDSDFSANGLMERTGSGSYTSNTTILQTENLALHYAIGWHTFAVIKGRDLVGSSGQRGHAQFLIQDKRSSRHRTARIEAGHMFGRDGSNFLNLLGTSGYGNEIAFTEFRIKEGNTYDGAALQIYISNDQNDIDINMMFDLATGDSWTLLGTMLADSDTAGHDALLGYASGGYVDFATSMAVGESIDIEETGFVDSNDGGGIITTGGLVVQGSARVAGTFRQGVTNAVLVADANGDLAPASNLTDDVFVTAGFAGQDPYNIVDPANWLGAPPATIEEALNRLEVQVAILGGPIP